ncbi:MAG: hypothetical protein IKN36_04620 [Clostridia bacterium]|nr:hypothetical protein [Clostridia bacterium]MBR7033915.1 hypothetical protein [Clostridia bacterium]
MKDVRTLLTDLSALISPPSGEIKVKEYIKEYIGKNAQDAEISEDALGTLTVAFKGKRDRSVMLAASSDESVFVVNDADDAGRIRFASLGKLSPSAAAYAEAEFENGVHGTVVPLDKNASLPDDPLKYGVDICASSKEEALRGAAPGTAFRPTSSLLVNGDVVTGPSVAAKAGVAVLLETAAILSGKEPENTVLLTFTSQGKVGARSAGPAAVAASPSAAVSVICVSDFAGGKITLGNGPVAAATTANTVADPRVRDALGAPVAVIERTRVPDDGAAAARFISAGVPAGVLCIPCRYQNTPRETVNVRDISEAAKILSEFVDGEF